MQKHHFFSWQRDRFIFLKSSPGLGNSPDIDYDESDAKLAVDGGKSYAEIRQIKELELSIRGYLNIPGLIKQKEQTRFAKELADLKKDPTANITDYEQLHKQIENITAKRSEIHDKLMEIEDEGLLPKEKLKMVKDELAKPTTDLERETQLVSELVAETKERERNRKEYEGLLEKNAKYFSAKSKHPSIKEGPYMKGFLELVDIKEQTEWLRNFDKKILTYRKGLVDMYEAFGSGRQGKFSNFMNQGSGEKEDILEDMKADLKSEYRRVTNESSSLSDESKDFAISYFMSIDFKSPTGIQQAEKALVDVRNRIATEDQLCREFKELSPGVRRKVERDFATIYEGIIKDGLRKGGYGEIQHKSTPRSFKELCAEERTVLMKHIRGHRSEFEKESVTKTALTKKYTEELAKIDAHAKAKGLKGKVIADGTKDSFMQWFEKQIDQDATPDKSQSKALIDQVSINNPEYSKRVDRLETFEKLLAKDELGLTEEKKAKLLSEFNELSYTERGNKILELQREVTGEGKEKGTTSGAIKNMKYAASIKEVQGKIPEALKLYEAILVLNPDDKPTQKRIEELRKEHGLSAGSETMKDGAESKVTPEESTLIASAIKEAQHGELMKKTLTIAYMAQLMGTLALKSDRINRGLSRKSHLDGNDAAGKIDLQDEIEGYTGGKALLGKDGKAKEKRRVDLTKIGQDSSKPDEMHQLGRYLTPLQDERAQMNVFDLEVRDRVQGRTLTGEEAHRLGDQLAEDALDDMIDRTCALLGSKMGGPVKPHLKREIERQIIMTGLQQLRGGRLDLH